MVGHAASISAGEWVQISGTWVNDRIDGLQLKANSSFGSIAMDRAAKGTHSQAIGKYRGGLTTKILALTDALAISCALCSCPGQRYDTVGMAPLIKDAEFDRLIAKGV